MEFERNGNGYWFVFEGTDGCGKTTVANHIFEWLRDVGLGVLQLREPTNGSRAGRFIRTFGDQLSDAALLALFLQDRMENAFEVIVPTLNQYQEEGDLPQVVLQDRSWMSTAVYQGRALDIQNAIVQLSLAIFPLPNLVFFLDVDAETAQQRCQQKTSVALEKYDRQSYAYSYRYLMQKYEDQLPLRVIDASQPLEQVVQEVKNAIRAHMGEPSWL